MSKADKGLRLFVTGLGMKVLLANRLGGLWNSVGAIGFESISTHLAWLGILAYSLQIYFDFYGYSRMLWDWDSCRAFIFPSTSVIPYLVLSTTDFWRRWLITLGGWFRDYVYIPLGGNRKGILFMVCNTCIVWLQIYLCKLFPFFRPDMPVLFSGDMAKYTKQYLPVLLLALLFCTRLPGKLYKAMKNAWPAVIFLLAVFWASVYCLCRGKSLFM